MTETKNGAAPKTKHERNPAYLVFKADGNLLTQLNAEPIHAKSRKEAIIVATKGFTAEDSTGHFLVIPAGAVKVIQRKVATVQEDQFI